MLCKFSETFLIRQRTIAKNNIKNKYCPFNGQCRKLLRCAWNLYQWFLKFFIKKWFSMNFFLQWLQRYKILFFFLFLTLWTYFLSKYCEFFWVDSLKVESVEIFLLSVYRFFFSAPLQCTPFLAEKRLLGT